MPWVVDKLSLIFRQRVHLFARVLGAEAPRKRRTMQRGSHGPHRYTLPVPVRPHIRRVPARVLDLSVGELGSRINCCAEMRRWQAYKRMETSESRSQNTGNLKISIETNCESTKSSTRISTSPMISTFKQSLQNLQIVKREYNPPNALANRRRTHKDNPCTQSQSPRALIPGIRLTALGFDPNTRSLYKQQGAQPCR